MTRKMKSSLAAKICILAVVLFLAASGILYGVVFKILPVYYGSQLLEESGEGEPVDSVIILSEQGDILWPDLKSAPQTKLTVSYISASEGEEYIRRLSGMRNKGKKGKHRKGAGKNVRSMAEAGEKARGMTNAEARGMTDAEARNAVVNGGVMAAALEQKELLIVYGREQTIDQAVELLHRMFPWILGIFAVMSALFMAAAYLYLAVPVAHLGQIAGSMVNPKPGVRYQGRRTDEIGILGRRLNELSDRFSSRLAELQQTEEELQRVNDKLKADLEREKAAEKERLTFFSVVSHELKTPLTILKAHLCGMLLGIGEYRNRDYYLKRSQESVERMEVMVQELLTLSRIEHHTFLVRPTDIAQQLRQQLADMRELMREKGLELSADVPEHLTAEVNDTMTGEVFSNLLMNAIRYTPENQGNQIRVRLEKDTEGRNEIRCSIENTGVFIPQESLPRLFEAFYRGDQPGGCRAGGTGLGLYIVKMILDRHGARYCMENTEEGVRFSFWLCSCLTHYEDALNGRGTPHANADNALANFR